MIPTVNLVRRWKENTFILHLSTNLVYVLFSYLFIHMTFNKINVNTFHLHFTHLQQMHLLLKGNHTAFGHRGRQRAKDESSSELL